MKNYLTIRAGKLQMVLILPYLILTACSGSNSPNDDTGGGENPPDTTQTGGQVPKVQTLEVANLSKASAKVSGKITSDGGQQISERGVAWDTASGPDIDGNHMAAIRVSGSGEFTVTLSDLSPQTQYYVRAYAKNEKGVGYGDEVSFTTRKDLTAGLADQIVRVKINKGKQQFMGAGAAGASGSSWGNLSASNRGKAARLVAQDINLKFIKTYIGDVPAKDPSKYDNAIEVFNDLKAYNPDLKFQVTVNNLPNNLELKKGNGGTQKGRYDPDISNIFDKIATYYFKVLKGFKQRGVPVDQLDVVNEPEGSHKYVPPGMDGALYIGKLFAQAVPKLRAMINDPTINNDGVTMPKIVGPSCKSVRRCINWLTTWKNKLPAAFNNTDIISTHGYINGWVESDYRAIHDLAEGKPFMNNEQTGKIKEQSPLGEYYSAGNEPNYVDDASIALLLTDAINGGVNYFFAFRLFNTSGNNAALLKTKNNQVSKSIIYDGFKQITSLQPDGSTVLENELTNTGDSRIVSFRKDDENKVYLDYTNISPEVQKFSIVLSNDGQRASMSTIKGWINDETRSDELALDKDFGPQGITHFEFTATPFSVNSFEIEMID